jgi:hypothetical protein
MTEEEKQIREWIETASTDSLEKFSKLMQELTQLLKDNQPR